MEELVAVTTQLGFSEPTLIQKKVYQFLKAGKNVLGLAPTGSGKTLAYVLPLLQITQNKAGTQLLVVTPSQELTAQVTQVIRECLQQLKLTLIVTPLGGGANVKRQQEKLKKTSRNCSRNTRPVIGISQKQEIKAASIADSCL